MKITSYFTEGELDLALTFFADTLEDQELMNETSITYDAGDKLINLKEKIEFFRSMQNEVPQE
jgi:hypothetical protein